ncbi:TetR/AcrR family transcriptional regulator [Streptomyces sp. ODS05-4]|uniref:TetR/AcrR family transcriptional regulator n=1 Tax=Streptomyces sp. ODS05-4 TaxID=2944939 RepID=UPI00210C7BA4|nr:TetR/AcrR family transcriptional regulator [Streptomyces sp. ODS05-4]
MARPARSARAALSADSVVDIALALVDEEGTAALTLSAVAGRAGVATPSLYKHVRSLGALRGLMSARVVDDLAGELGSAVRGRSSDEAVRALMTAWRGYVRRNPRRYTALQQAPGPHTAEAGERLIGIVHDALHAYGLDRSAAVHAVRCIRAATHGFAALEAEDAFGLLEPLDESFALLTRMVIAGLSTPTAAVSADQGGPDRPTR